MDMSAIKTKNGVTLVELVVVLAIVSILALLSTAYLRGFTTGYRLDTAAKDMASRLRLAKTISITRNSGVSVLINAASDSYYAFLDRNKNGVKDAGEAYINIDSGKETGSLAIATKELHERVDMYAVDFNGSNTFTVGPPAGLPDTTMLPPAALNGVVCFQVQVGDDYKYRRITVVPVVGRMTLWTAIAADPGCPTDNDTDWQEAY